MSEPSHKPVGHVLIGLIAHRPEMDCRVSQCIEGTARSLAALGWWSNLVPFVGSADLAGARNNIVAEFLAGPFTDLLFVDSDVSWQPGAIERLLSYPVDVAIGAYPHRIEGPRKFSIRAFPGKIEFVDPTTGKPDPKGLLEVQGGPTGCMRISRNCLEKMTTAYADTWYNEPMVTGGKAWNIFEFAIVDKQRMTEDINFCRLWRAIGGKVWVDPHLTLFHHGGKSYEGNLAQHLEEIGRMKVSETPHETEVA